MAPTASTTMAHSSPPFSTPSINNNDDSMMFSPTSSAGVSSPAADTTPSWTVDTARHELRHAVSMLSHHGLKLAAKWACEQLIGLPSCEEDYSITIPQQDDNDIYAKSLLDLGEYAHAASVLSHPNKDVGTISPPLPNLSRYGIYIRAYSMYLAGERRKGEELVELKEPLERTTVRNPFLSQLRDELQDAHDSQNLDAFGLYIYGVVLKELEDCGCSSSTTTSYNILMDSLLQFPCNWSAWLDLAELCLEDAELHSVVQDKLMKKLGSHYTFSFFCAHVFDQDQAQPNSIAIMTRLLYTQEEEEELFCQSPYLLSKMAVAHYHLRDFDYAQDCFATLYERDPYRLEDLDVYSNILYVQENSVTLSQLAHDTVFVDKYRPETCCIVGNYYSLKMQRTKAVQYFQRALQLDGNYTSAWTLMGHEYVEMKNTAAAMEAYRRAVDVNDRDYRAWYGLGQTYEFLNMHLYALFYYRKAAALRPYDARMWCAMGGCYLALEKRNDAIRTYERAVQQSDTEGIATQKLAALYRQDGEEEKAARCYLRHLELRYKATCADDVPSVNLETIINGVLVQATEAEALLFLASYHKHHGEYETAAMCCSRLLEYPGPEKEEGKALLREIRSRRERTSLGREEEEKSTISFEFSP